jgi:hypothetical protein
LTTATIEKTDVIRFEAQGEGLRFVVEPQAARIDTTGKIVPLPGTGKTIEFNPDGLGAQFYETTDPEEIEYLRGRMNDPVRPTKIVERPPIVPPSGPTLAEVAKMAATRDVDGLAKLYRKESDNWQREDVLQSIDAVSNMLSKTEK